MSRLVIGTIPLSMYGYTPPRASEFYETLEGTSRGIAGRGSRRAQPVGRGSVTQAERSRWTAWRSSSPASSRTSASIRSSFRRLGIRLVEGRDFGGNDRDTSPPVAIVSESLAKLVGGGASPLGRRLGGFSAAAKPLEIVGVVSDVITNVTVMEPLIIYLPATQGAPSIIRDVHVRAAGNTAAAKAQIVAVVKQLDPQVTTTTLRTLEERIAEQMAPQRLGATVLGALGAIAVLLTLLGTYVLAESMASSRMREMGIRAALGATRRQLGLDRPGRNYPAGGNRDSRRPRLWRWTGTSTDPLVPLPGRAVRSDDGRSGLRADPRPCAGGELARGAEGRTRRSRLGAAQRR